MDPYSYNRRLHLPAILRVPSDWLTSSDPAIGALILERLDTALAAQLRDGPRIRALRWAQAAEKRAVEVAHAYSAAPAGTH